LGWWHSQYMESHKIPWFQTTNQIKVISTEPKKCWNFIVLLSSTTSRDPMKYLCQNLWDHKKYHVSKQTFWVETCWDTLPILGVLISILGSSTYSSPENQFSRYHQNQLMIPVKIIQNPCVNGANLQKKELYGGIILHVLMVL
jgi:hypothetical protein